MNSNDIIQNWLDAYKKETGLAFVIGGHELLLNWLATKALNNQVDFKTAMLEALIFFRKDYDDVDFKAEKAFALGFKEGFEQGKIIIERP